METNKYTNSCNYYQGETHRCYGQKATPLCYCNGNTSKCEIASYSRVPDETSYTVFKRNLVIALKEYIKDYIKAYIKDDKLIVEFYHQGYISTVYVEPNPLHKIEHNLDTATLAERIYKWYKSIILSRYFKK